jgi:hypothetical protein
LSLSIDPRRQLRVAKVRILTDVFVRLIQSNRFFFLCFTVNDANEYYASCRRPTYNFGTADYNAQYVAGYEGVAPLWANLVNVTVSCAIGDDSVIAGKKWMKISWFSEETIQPFTSDLLGASNFSLLLSNSGFNGIGTEYVVYQQNRSATSDYFARGSWSYLSQEYGRFCYDNLTAPSIEPDYAWRYQAICGNGIVDPGEECDQGPNSTSCINCVCSVGFTCSGSTVSPLPPMSSVSSLLVMGSKMGQVFGGNPNFGAPQYVSLLPGLNAASVEQSYLEYFSGYQFCDAFLASNGDYSDCNTVYNNDYVASAAFRPVSYPDFEASVVVKWSNGTTFLSSISGSRPNVYADPVGFGLLPDNGLLVNTNLTNSIGSTAYGCKYPQVLYVISFETATSEIVLRAYNDSNGVQMPSFGVYRVTWVPDGLQQPQAMVAVNGSSQNIYLFVYSWNSTQSRAHILTPELSFVSRTPWSLPLRDGFSTQLPVSAAYFPDYDAFGFSMTGATGIFEVDRAAFQLGFPSRYSSGISRIVSLPARSTFIGEYANFPFVVGNNFCCKSECYNGHCNSASGQCVCNPGFTGSTCSTFSRTFVPAPSTSYAVMRKVADTYTGQRLPISGCADPVTGAVSIQFGLNATILDTLSVPFNTSVETILDFLPNITVSGPVTINMNKLFCQADPSSSTLMPMAGATGAQYAPFYTLVPIIEIKPNVTQNTTYQGVYGEIMNSAFPNDPKLFHIRPVSSFGGTHKLVVSSDGLCIAGFSSLDPSETMPALSLEPRIAEQPGKKRRVLNGGDCEAANRFQLNGYACASSFTVDPKNNATLVNDFWFLVGCSEGVNLTVSYTFAPPTTVDTNCSLASVLGGVSCNSSTNGSTITLTNSTTFYGNLYVPKGTTFELNDHTLNIVGDLYFGGNITSIWSYGNSTASRKKRAAPGSPTIPSASIGSSGSVVVSGCANLGDTTLNVLVDASTLPPGSSSSSQSQTSVVVNPVIFDCGNATNVKQNTQIINDDDQCVEHNVKSSTASSQKQSLQVLFSFETTPTGSCNVSAPGTVIGNDLEAGKIAGIAVAVIGGLLVIGVIIYLASPACRSKTTPYRGTTV